MTNRDVYIQNHDNCNLFIDAICIPVNMNVNSVTSLKLVCGDKRKWEIYDIILKTCEVRHDKDKYIIYLKSELFTCCDHGILQSSLECNDIYICITADIDFEYDIIVRYKCYSYDSPSSCESNINYESYESYRLSSAHEVYESTTIKKYIRQLFSEYQNSVSIKFDFGLVVFIKTSVLLNSLLIKPRGLSQFREISPHLVYKSNIWTDKCSTILYEMLDHILPSELITMIEEYTINLTNCEYVYKIQSKIMVYSNYNMLYRFDNADVIISTNGIIIDEVCVSTTCYTE
jgi:hypothetical protein